jgi:hypothetical protein
MKAYEKLGLFYLGKVIDRQSNALTSDYLMYDSRDLLTHAVCVGMTGSGKTGLCLAALEEAAIDGIPVIAIDPKGDLGNLLLTFPGLSPAEFRPWVNEEEAQRKGMSVEEFAASEAQRWRQGLAEWDEDGDRIRLLQSSAETALYTPGSTAGISVSIVDSFSAPAPALPSDLEPLRDRASTLTAGLLGLLGIAADPLRSREHILIASILEQAWLAGKDLTLASLIQAIQSPPLQRVGVFDLESFYPSTDRLQLAMMMNNLLAAPGFASWMEGETLDISRLLHNRQGKPRTCIFSIAHLSDNERMFFVTLLLNQILGWARSQAGTTSLRAVLYMDEIFGFLPPVVEPPSKRPLMTLLKQARAYGLGVVLATQNPVDLDYKALSNAGTWFIGRLQTERDRDRLLDGLSGTLGGGATQISSQESAQIISSLKNRVFLMHTVHEDHPVLFGTRWALSYLAGPLTRAQIRQLTEGQEVESAPAPQAPVTVEARAVDLSQAATDRIPLPAGLKELFAPLARPAAIPGEVTHHPFLYAAAKVQIVNNKYSIASSEVVQHILELEPNMVQAPWIQALPLTAGFEDLARVAPQDAQYLPLPTRLLQEKPLDGAMKGYIDFLYRQWPIRLWKSNTFKLVSQPGEAERDFRVRLQQLAREKRDFELDKLRQRYAVKVNSLQRQLLRAQERQAREQDQYTEQKASTVIALGSTLLGALIGRKAISTGTLGRATTAARQASRISREKQDIQRAEEEVRTVQQQLQEIDEQVRQESDQISLAYDPQAETLQEIVIRPAKADILLQTFGILWVPFLHSPAGKAEQLFP